MKSIIEKILTFYNRKKNMKKNIMTKEKKVILEKENINTNIKKNIIEVNRVLEKNIKKNQDQDQETKVSKEEKEKVRLKKICNK